MIRLPTDKPPADPREAALWWATRRLSAPPRDADDPAFADWLADPANAAAWEEMDRRVALVGSFAAAPEVTAMRRQALAFARAQSAARRRRRLWLGGSGSALAAGFAAALLWTGQLEKPFIAPTPAPVADSTPSSAMADATANYVRHATRVGERRDIALPDGSRVTLNTASLIELRYTPERREIRLLAGQALFRVAKDAARPFVVAAGSRLITATGTAFDVRLHERAEVDVVLVEGSVTIEPARPRGLARLIPALAREELEPGQRLTAPADGESATVTIGDVEKSTAWNRGILVFRADSIAAAVAEVNRYTPTQILIHDATIGELTVSGVFPTERPKDFVAALTAFYPIEARRTADATIELRWRKPEEESKG